MSLRAPPRAHYGELCALSWQENVLSAAAEYTGRTSKPKQLGQWGAWFVELCSMLSLRVLCESKAFYVAVFPTCNHVAYGYK
jgi:hypothetical protein